MDKIRVIIADDEPLARRGICQMLAPSDEDSPRCDETNQEPDQRPALRNDQSQNAAPRGRGTIDIQRGQLWEIAKSTRNRAGSLEFHRSLRSDGRTLEDHSQPLVVYQAGAQETGFLIEYCYDYQSTTDLSDLKDRVALSFLRDRICRRYR